MFSFLIGNKSFIGKKKVQCVYDSKPKLIRYVSNSREMEKEKCKYLWKLFGPMVRDVKCVSHGCLSTCALIRVIYFL